MSNVFRVLGLDRANGDFYKLGFTSDIKATREYLTTNAWKREDTFFIRIKDPLLEALEKPFTYERTDETFKVIETRKVKQSELDCSCWSVQIRGKIECETCEYRDTKDCGGTHGNALLIRQGKKEAVGKVVKMEGG